MDRRKKADNRFKSINAFEELLAQDNNTIIIKFFLNISEQEQANQLQERIDDPTKKYKHSDNDWEERKLWDKYMVAYQDILNRSTIPWHVIPVDKR